MRVLGIPDSDEAPLDITPAFTEALRRESAGPDAHPLLLPQHLIRAAAAVLDVLGVGLSVHSRAGQRTPLAASSEAAGIVEGLQFTAGSGPCLLAGSAELPVFATGDLIAERWPAFSDMLVLSTSVRSILAMPLPGRLRSIAVLDLYFSDPQGAVSVDVYAARQVARLISRELDREIHWTGDGAPSTPDWWDSSTTSARDRMWAAVGMVIAALRVPAPDALALLRARAYASGRSVDDVAADLVAGRVGFEELRTDVTDER